jgi:hypothetical protein
MSYAKQLFDKGIKFRIGTDCANGGKAIISEQLLLARMGFQFLQFFKYQQSTAQLHWP